MDEYEQTVEAMIFDIDWEKHPCKDLISRTLQDLPKPAVVDYDYSVSERWFKRG